MHQQYLAVEQWYLVVATIVQQAVLYGFMDLFGLVFVVRQIIQNGAQFFFRKKRRRQTSRTKIYRIGLVQLQ